MLDARNGERQPPSRAEEEAAEDEECRCFPPVRPFAAQDLCALRAAERHCAEHERGEEPGVAVRLERRAAVGQDGVENVLFNDLRKVPVHGVVA